MLFIPKWFELGKAKSNPCLPYNSNFPQVDSLGRWGQFIWTSCIFKSQTMLKRNPLLLPPPSVVMTVVTVMTGVSARAATASKNRIKMSPRESEESWRIPGNYKESKTVRKNSKESYEEKQSQKIINIIKESRIILTESQRIPTSQKESQNQNGRFEGMCPLVTYEY